MSHPPSKDQLHLIGTAKAQVRADYLLEEHPSAHRADQDLCEGELRLQDGPLIAIPGQAVLRSKRMRQTFEPFA